MKKTATALLALVFVSTMATAAFAVGPGPWYVKGDYYAGSTGLWNFDAGNTMHDDGLNGDGNAADNIFTALVVADQAAGKKEFKVANADWSESYFGPCNLWVHIAGPGDMVRFTFDTNQYADGWLPEQNIVWSDHYAPPGTMFEVIGSAPETGNWNSGVPAALVGNIWTLNLVIATPGNYGAKFRALGTWDLCNVGAEGAAAPCGADLPYTTVLPNSMVTYEFDTLTGRARIQVQDPVSSGSSSWGRIKTLYR